MLKYVFSLGYHVIKNTVGLSYKNQHYRQTVLHVGRPSVRSPYFCAVFNSNRYM